MSTGADIIGPVGCTLGCGDCCDPVLLGTEQRKRFEAQAAHPELEDHPDVFANLLFIAEHWSETGRDDEQTYYKCDKFDRTTRTCTAHKDRPAICRGFPFYGQVPNADQLGGARRCSYWWNIPRDQWMDGIRPLIPITAVKR